MNKSITFIAQFPPPIHGLSKAVDTLYHSRLNNEYEFTSVNITNNKAIGKTLWNIWKSKSDLYYFTISQTKGGNWRDLVILKLLELKHAKCLIHLHGGYYRQLVDYDCGKWQRRLNYHAIRRLAGCIVLGKSLQPIFEGMIYSGKIFTVPNCVDAQYMLAPSEAESKIRKAAEESTLDVLYLSNFIPTKGYREVLQLALKCKNEKNKCFHFHFAGKFFEETEKAYFKNYISEHDLGAYVTYHGVVTGNRKKELLRRSHIFMLLTRYSNEGQPISILEAMGNAMLVITTNHAGIPDIIKNGENGLMIDKSSIVVDEIYRYLVDMYNDRDTLRTVCLRNYHDVIQSYTEERYIHNMDVVFKKVLSDGK